jgi:hypothetical protein
MARAGMAGHGSFRRDRGPERDGGLSRPGGPNWPRRQGEPGRGTALAGRAGLVSAGTESGPGALGAARRPEVASAGTESGAGVLADQAGRTGLGVKESGAG